MRPAPLTTVDEVLDRYTQALGYAEPFKQRSEVTRPDGSTEVSGFDGAVAWTVGRDGAALDTSTPLESVRRDADLQYPLHQPDYFTTLALAGVVDFEGARCYWLHGTTHWGKDNNQFYDVATGLLRGYRFQSDDKASVPTILVFDDYKRVGARLVPTKMTIRSGATVRTFTATSVSDEPIPDTLFAMPEAVRALLPAGG